MNISLSKYISAKELSLILNISEATVKALAKNSQIPFRKEKNRLCFDFNEVMEHFRKLEGGAA